MRFRPLVALALVLLSGGAFACRKDSVASYRIPKEKDPEMPLAAADAPTAEVATGKSMADTAVPTAGDGTLRWTAPSPWKSKPASSMRKATYTVPGAGGEADLAVTAFPGDVGGEAANVNRWRGQVQLPPLGDAEALAQIQRVEHNGLRFGVVDLVGAGQNPPRVLGAFVRIGDATWFFKLAGPAAVVAAAKADFLQFLATIQPATPATP